MAEEVVLWMAGNVIRAEFNYNTISVGGDVRTERDAYGTRRPCSRILAGALLRFIYSSHTNANSKRKLTPVWLRQVRVSLGIGILHKNDS